jgi:hypothetical protein
MYFKPTTGTLKVTPEINGVGETTESITSLAFDAGAVEIISNVTGANSPNIESAIVKIIEGINAGTTASKFQDITAIIKAAGGTNGFVGLE